MSYAYKFIIKESVCVFSYNVLCIIRTSRIDHDDFVRHLCESIHSSSYAQLLVLYY